VRTEHKMHPPATLHRHLRRAPQLDCSARHRGKMSESTIGPILRPGSTGEAQTRRPFCAFPAEEVTPCPAEPHHKAKLPENHSV